MNRRHTGLTRRQLLQTGVTAGAGLAFSLASEQNATAGVGQNPRKRLLLIAGTPSHPPMMHEYNAGCLLLKKCLESVSGLETVLALNGWPKEAAVFEGVDAVFLFMDGGGGHAAIQQDRLTFLDGLMKRGIGLGCAHFAVEVPADRGGKQFQEWIGGHYEHQFSCNPIWKPEFKPLPKHPVSRGVKPFIIEDEWYFNMRFRLDNKGIIPILVAVPSDQVRKGPYVYPRGPYDHIVAASGRAESMLWVAERAGDGRGFGFTGGHFHKNWGNEDFRKVVLNALVWIAKADVPRNGVQSTVTEADLIANLDPKPGSKKPEL